MQNQVKVMLPEWIGATMKKFQANVHDYVYMGNISHCDSGDNLAPGPVKIRCINF